MTFFVSVVHSFKPGKVEAWWAAMGAAMQDPAKMEKFAADAKAAGYFNHSFLPVEIGSDKKINCLWECRDAECAAKFQEFIDGPMGPGNLEPGLDAMENECIHAIEGAMTPASAFAEGFAPAEAKATTGAFWWVYHTFKEGKAEGWWKNISAAMSDETSMKAMQDGYAANGMHNHSFCPGGGDKPMVCIWESREDVDAAHFQAFIDGKHGPGGECLVNTCYKVAAGAQHPSAHFAKEE